MAKVYIDNIEYEVADGKNMLEVCLSLGMNLTYFCWHPAMHSVGACRQCGVIQYRDENDTKGKIVMACMLDANNGTRISIKDQKGHDFRAGNIEALMLNHPHDCPVCDEGGECHLQDMTVMSGHNYRRYRFNKRTHVDQDLGPFIYHEMNRCIQCYRCTRFYNDYAGGKDFGVFSSAGRVYFGRSQDGTLENEFSGNLVEVCPTGVFTDKTLRKHYTRKWDLTSSPSICQQCSVGCNVLASERYGGVRRIITRFNGDVNGYFLCDRGRFGYEYANDEKRLTRVAQKESSAEESPFLSIKNHIASKPKMIGIGSPRASLESNFMLKQLVGQDNFFQGIPKKEGVLTDTVLNVLRSGTVRTPSLAEIEKYDTIFILGEDVTNTAPMIALALRQAAKTLPRQKAYDLRIQHWNDAAIREVVQGDTGPFFIAAPYATKLDEIATTTYFGDTQKLVSLAKMIAGNIQNNQENSGGDQAQNFANQVGKALSDSKKPLIVSGTGMMSKAIIECAADIAAALKTAGRDVGIAMSVPETNSMGLAMLEANGYLEDAMERASKENDITAVVLETNLFYRTDKGSAEKFLENCNKTILLDCMENETTPFADFILPAGTFAESDGTLVNNEGRAQRYYQVFPPKNDMLSSWAWLDMMIHGSDIARPFDDIVSEMINQNQAFEKIQHVAPSADYRIGTQKIARETHRFSGLTATTANIDVHEPKPPMDNDSPLTYTMEGYHGQKQPSPDIPYYWAPAWNSIQAINKYQIEVGGPLHNGNPGKRLIEPNESGTSRFLKEQDSQMNGTFEILPEHFIFGSGELSSLSPGIAQRIPEASISISEKALEKYGLSGTEKIKINYTSNNITLPVKINNSLPENVILIPKGFKETAGLQFPFYGDISGV